MKTKGLNAFQLKLFMALLMVFDHLGKIPGLLSAIVAVEGFRYTRSRLLYNLRLFFWAMIMFVGNTILNLLFQSKGIQIYNNIFLTLACGVLALILFFGISPNDDPINIKRQPIRFILGLIVCLLAGLVTEGGLPIIPFMLITYICREKKKLRNLLYGILAVILFCMSIQIYPSWSDTLLMMFYNSDWLFITVLPFISLYNGERGPATKWSKYFFYVFYPAHLWLITCIAYLVQK